MTGPDDKGVHADLDAILRALLVERDAAEAIGRQVIAWLRDNRETVAGHAHAYMAAMAIREALAAVADGSATPRDPALVARYEEVPVAERTAVALHLLADHPIAETADLVRRPMYEVAGLVADFSAPRPSEDHAGSEEDGEAGDDADGSGRRPKRRSGRRARTQPTIVAATPDREVPKAPPSVRPAFLIALGVVLVALAAAYVGSRVFGGSDGAGANGDGDGSISGPVAALRQSEGCSAASAADVLEDEWMAVDVDGEERTARVFAPQPRDGEPRGLIIDLADLGRPIDLHLASTQIRTMPVRSPMVIATVLPVDGLPQWNVADVADEPADVDTVLATIGAVGSRLCLDLSRVYLVGFGAGGHLAGVSACRDPEAFAGVVMLAGFLRPDDCGDGPVDGLVVVAPTDDVFPTDGGRGPGFDSVAERPAELRSGASYEIPRLDEMLGGWADQAGCDPVTEENVAGLAAKVYAGCEGDSRLVLLTASDVGHVWPQSAVPAVVEFLS